MEGVSFDGLMVLSSIQMMGMGPGAPGSRFPVSLGNYRSILGAATAGKRVSRAGKDEAGPSGRSMEGGGRGHHAAGRALMQVPCRRVPALRVPAV